MRRPLPSQKRLKELFSYRGGRLYRGECEAGYKEASGYRRVKVDGVLYFAHRLVWMWHHGSDPGPYLDHLNEDKADNRIENLNPITNSQNIAKGKHKHKKSDLPAGVARHRNKYKAQRRVGDKLLYLGLYSTPEQAHQAYLNYEQL
jgi:hypothetical protein